MEESVLIPDNLPIPDFNPELQYLGKVQFNEASKEWFWPVLNYTDAQLENIKRANVKRQANLIISQKQSR